MATSTPVVLLPGIITPGAIAFAPLVESLGGRATGHVKELEVYAPGHDPSRYTLDTEVEALARFAGEHAPDGMHLVGFSGGGAVALAYCARHSSRLRSLTLIEPAWAGSGRSAAEDEARTQVLEGLALGDAEMLPAFARLQLAPGVEPPPPVEPRPDWMAGRPAGIRAFAGSLAHAAIDDDGLRAFRGPVLFVLGGLSNPYWRVMADRLEGIFADYICEVYDDAHHLAAPHVSAPGRFAESLLALWDRATSPSAVSTYGAGR